MNAESELVTSLEVTSGGAYDGHHFVRLVERDRQQNLSVETYAADKGYDDGNNHFYLKVHGLHSTRTQKKDAPLWLALEQSEAYQQGLQN